MVVMAAHAATRLVEIERQRSHAHAAQADEEYIVAGVAHVVEQDGKSRTENISDRGGNFLGDELAAFRGQLLEITQQHIK